MYIQNELLQYEIIKDIARGEKQKALFTKHGFQDVQEYQVEVIETLSRITTVVASSKIEAIKLVEAKYRDEEIVLTSDDWVDTEFLVREED